MNTFGKLFRVSIFGESHGTSVGVLVDGCPAGLPLAVEEFLPDLERRRSGKRGTTARKEDDRPSILSGVFNGKTTGAAIAIVFENGDADSTAYDELRKTPRPGQADLVAFHKYGGFNDYRGGGIFSGRLTVCLVAAGIIAKKIIRPVFVEATLVEAGGSVEVQHAIEAAMARKDSLGGTVECRARHIPVGLGEPLFDSAESLFSHIVFSIPGIKGIEFGAGFAGTKMAGSEFNDEILSVNGLTLTNNAGGINGGITNGNELVFRAAVRPTASIPKSQMTVDTETGNRCELSIGGRHDVCFALRVPVIIEAATAIVIADMMLMEQRIPRTIKGEGEWI
jgi:chorismate synthase